MARVLVVEDEPDARRVLCESVHGLGHQADAACDGIEALERFRDGRYDVVITDMAMPRMDGIELTSRLKSLDPSVAVLMVTGQGSLDLMARAVNRGIADYLRKPLRLATLEETVQRTLGRRGLAVIPRGPARWSRLTRWLLFALAGVVALLFLWRVWQQESDMRALARRVEGIESRTR